MATTENFTIKVKADARSAITSIKNLTKQIEALPKQLQSMNKQMSQMSKAQSSQFKSITTGIEKMNKELTTSVSKFKELQRAQSSFKAPSTKVDLTKKVTQPTTRLPSQPAAQLPQTSMPQQSRQPLINTQSIQAAIGAVSNFGSQIQQIGAGLQRFGASITANLTKPILGFGADSVQTAMQFEKSMSKVGAIAGASGEDMKLLKDKALEMGAKTKFSAVEASEALTYMGMA